MNKEAPIVIIDDDKDDQDILVDVANELNLPNKLQFFGNTNEAFAYLKSTSDKPLVIISDINLPQESGVELKRRIDEDYQLREKSIPFIFFSTYIEKRIVDIAYKELTIQGFFKKSNHYNEIKDTFKMIIDYWSVCKHPNSI